MKHLDATEIAEAVRSGATTPALVAGHFLERIGLDEPDVQAFVSFDQSVSLCFIRVSVISETKTPCTPSQRWDR